MLWLARRGGNEHCARRVRCPGSREELLGQKEERRQRGGENVRKRMDGESPWRRGAAEGRGGKGRERGRRRRDI